jgi:hypothetical protein
VKFKYTEGFNINGYKEVSVKKMNHIIEVKSVAKEMNGFQDYKKISKSEYMQISTGEIYQYDQSENRADNIAGLKDTFRKLRDLINNNFTGAGNELHVTLTYKENMTDTKRLYADFKAFWMRYRRKYGMNIDYLTVVEPQERGAWHCHILIRHNDLKKVYIPQKEIVALWGQGFIKVKALEGVDNIGAYLSAYLGDVELTEENIANAVKTQQTIKVAKVDGKQKKFIKGGRLHLYPPGMNLYRHSKGIVFPEVERMEYQEVKKIVGSRKPDYTRTITIIDEENGKVLNTITYENYNTKRNLCKQDADPPRKFKEENVCSTI